MILAVAELPGDLRLGDGRILVRQPAASVLGHDGHWYHRPTRFRVMAAWEPTEGRAHGQTYLHVSLSYQDHLPNWRDCKLIKAAFFGPNAAAMILLPEEAEYVNLHEYTHHLWQMPVCRDPRPERG